MCIDLHEMSSYKFHPTKEFNLSNDFKSRVVRDVLEWVDNHLSDDLSIEVVSGVAGYSRFHFQRIFKSHTGVNLAFYIRKERMKRAAKLLICSDDRMIDISFACGFDTQQSFSRSFKAFYNVTPSEYRSNSGIKMFDR